MCGFYLVSSLPVPNCHSLLVDGAVRSMAGFVFWPFVVKSKSKLGLGLGLEL